MQPTLGTDGTTWLMLRNLKSRPLDNEIYK